VTDEASNVERLKTARESAGYVTGVLGTLVVLGIAVGGPVWLKIAGPALASLSAITVLVLYVAERRARERRRTGVERPSDRSLSDAGDQPAMLRASPEVASEQRSEVPDEQAHPDDSTTTSAAWPDVFISHASEDKALVARPLATALTERGWSVWLDELELTVGDSLSRRIDDALAKSRFGVVILSPAFFAKEWPQRELAGLAAREVSAGAKIILPVWHNVDQNYIVDRSPTLADRLGSDTKRGIDVVAHELARALTVAQHRPLTTGSERVLRAPLEIAPETRRTRPAHRMRWLVAGSLCVAIVGAVVGVQALRGGPPMPVLDQFASSTRLEMAYPRGYRRVAANEVFPELNLKQAIAVQGPTHQATGRTAIASGFTNATGAELLPRSFRQSVDDDVLPERVRIGDYEALVYRAARLRVGMTRIYAIPTRDGVATTACTAVNSDVRSRSGRSDK
jgi:hypothetical protein